MGHFQEDRKGNVIQGFAPVDVVTVTQSVAWTPPEGVVAYCVPVDCTYTIGNSETPATLLQGTVRVIIPNKTYTFDTTMNIEVM